MIAERRLLRALATFANGGEDWRPLAVVFAAGVPTRWTMDAPQRQCIRLEAQRLLALLAENASDPSAYLEAEIEANPIGCVLRSRQPSRVIGPHGVRRGGATKEIPGFRPVALNPRQVPLAILAIARLTPTGQGDTLAERVAHCERCNHFFLLPTRRPARWCGQRCRDAAAWKRKRKAA